MSMEEIIGPAGLVILVLLALAFIRFRLWWAVLRVVLAPLLRPVGLVVVAVIAAIVVLKLS